MNVDVNDPFNSANPDWRPFRICARDERAPKSRSIQCPDGVGDRLRTAAFAELQAFHAFRWGAERFTDASPDLRAAWRELAIAEARHLDSLLKRMRDLGLAVDARPVSDWLWTSLIGCTSAREFARFMASSEERGRVAGVRFEEALRAVDPITAAIFGTIAEEEIEHIRLAERFFPTEEPVST